MSPLLEARTEDVEWLLRHGEHPENIARRVGFVSVSAADVFFRRNGRSDLALPFNNYAKRTNPR